MLLINVLTAFYERMKYENNMCITLKTVLPQGVGKTAPFLGQDSPLTVFASDTSMIHNFHIFCGLRCSITYLP